jgi:hypothetical protein
MSIDEVIGAARDAGARSVKVRLLDGSTAYIKFEEVPCAAAEVVGAQERFCSAFYEELRNSSGWMSSAKAAELWMRHVGPGRASAICRRINSLIRKGELSGVSHIHTLRGNGFSLGSSVTE